MYVHTYVPTYVMCVCVSGFSLGLLVVLLHYHLHSLHHVLSSGIQPAPPSLYGSTKTSTLF